MERKNMPQLILNSEEREYFKSFVVDCNKDVLKSLSWKDLFNIVSKKYNINNKKLYFKDYKALRISISYNEDLDIENFRMINSNTQEKTNDYWFSFGIRRT